MGLLRKLMGRKQPEPERERLPGQGFIMKRGEECYCDVEGVLIEQKVTRRRISGGSAGVSVRVTKRVTVRANRFQGELVPETALAPVSIGRLFISNQRVVFRGNNKSFSLALDKIMYIETFSDAVRLTSDKGGSPRIVRFTDAASAKQVRNVLSALFGDDDRA